MEQMSLVLIGYIAFIMMGLTLVIVGAGGSILTIPILIYLLDTPIIIATTYSLVIVGVSALLASLRYRNSIKFKKSINFAIPSVLGVFAARHFIIPNLPHSFGIISIDKALIFLLLMLMGLAGYFMIRNSSYNQEDKLESSCASAIKVVFIALSLGLMMGLLGAGGGFLIIPTLVILMGFSMQTAVPTSLFIITINSFIGVAADKHHFTSSDCINLITYLSYSLLGVIMGLYIAKFIKSEHLKKIFGYFIWIIGITILIKEFAL